MTNDENKIKKVQCLECKNDVPLERELIKPGYFFECPFCGVTMEIKEVRDDGTLHIIIVELEK